MNDSTKLHVLRVPTRVARLILRKAIEISFTEETLAKWERQRTQNDALVSMSTDLEG